MTLSSLLSSARVGTGRNGRDHEVIRCKLLPELVPLCVFTANMEAREAIRDMSSTFHKIRRVF